jgi:predicted small lipoprotein YifL
MRLFIIYLMLLLLLTASAAGCGSKAPADSNPPPGVIKNPVRPDPEIIRKRKLMLIDLHKGRAPSRINGKR